MRRMHVSSREQKLRWLYLATGIAVLATAWVVNVSIALSSTGTQQCVTPSTQKVSICTQESATVSFSAQPCATAPTAATECAPASQPSPELQWSTTQVSVASSQPSRFSVSSPEDKQIFHYVPTTQNANCPDKLVSLPTTQVSVVAVAIGSLETDVESERVSGGGTSERTYLVPQADGVVTVTASPAPADVSEAELPGCWQLTGGSGNGKLVRTVDRSTLGETVVKLSCGGRTETRRIIVFNASVTLYVEQPVPGTRATHNGVNSGHSFLQIAIQPDLAKDVAIQCNLLKAYANPILGQKVGMYPSEFVSPANPVAPACFHVPDNHVYTTTKTWDKLRIYPWCHAANFVGYSIGALPTSPGVYPANAHLDFDLNNYNCTVFAIDTANQAGLGVPYTKGTWPGGGGCNPGDLGQDLIEMGGHLGQ